MEFSVSKPQLKKLFAAIQVLTEFYPAALSLRNESGKTPLDIAIGAFNIHSSKVEVANYLVRETPEVTELRIQHSYAPRCPTLGEEFASCLCQKRLCGVGATLPERFNCTKLNGYCAE